MLVLYSSLIYKIHAIKKDFNSMRNTPSTSVIKQHGKGNNEEEKRKPCDGARAHARQTPSPSTASRSAVSSLAAPHRAAGRSSRPSAPPAITARVRAPTPAARRQPGPAAYLTPPTWALAPSPSKYATAPTSNPARPAHS